MALGPTQPPVKWVPGLSWDKERPGRDTEPSPLLAPWSRKNRAIPLLHLWAIRPVQSLSACSRVHFTYFKHKVFSMKQQWISLIFWRKYLGSCTLISIPQYTTSSTSLMITSVTVVTNPTSLKTKLIKNTAEFVEMENSCSITCSNNQKLQTTKPAFMHITTKHCVKVNCFSKLRLPHGLTSS